MTSLQHFEEQKFLGPLAPAVRRRLKEFDAEDLVSRIWSHDHTVWKPDPTEITNRLGWLTLATDMRPRIPELHAFAKRVAADGFTHAVLLGMGGSSLAPRRASRAAIWRDMTEGEIPSFLAAPVRLSAWQTATKAVMASKRSIIAILAIISCHFQSLSFGLK